MVFEDLKAFVVVARHGSFSQAAADLCIAQSALSKRVQRLEHRMGAPLLERRARGVALTEAGIAFLARAHRLVDEVGDLERNLSSFAQTPTGVVRIALPQRTCGLLAPPLIERCQRELPLVDLHVLEGTPSNVHEWLMQGEADIAMTYNRDIGAAFRVKPVLTEPLFLFGSREAAAAHFGPAGRSSCSLQDLGSLPMILPRKPNIVRLLVDRLSAANGVRLRTVFETDGMNTIRGMVSRGMGFTVFSRSTSWHDGVETGQLVALPFDSPLMNWKLYLVHARRDMSAVAVNRVNAIVEDELEQLIDSGAWPHAQRLGPDPSRPAVVTPP